MATVTTLYFENENRININPVSIDVCLIINPRSASLLGQIVFHFHKYFCVFKIENNS